MGPAGLMAVASLMVWATAVEDDMDSARKLAHLAETGNWSLLAQELRSGVNPNGSQPDGMTALHWAVHLDNPEIVQLLLNSGADANIANRYGVTPLGLACTNANAEIIRALLNASANPNAVLPGGETVLMTAARTGRPEPVRLLLSAGAKVDSADERNQTAVMWAAAEGHAEVVRILLNAGADFQTPLASGFTPLFFAVREGRTETVRVLLAAGADVNGVMEPRKSGGRAPRKGTSPLVMAVENGHFELAVDLLKAGANANDQRSGFTALHMLTWVRKPNRGDGEDGDPSPAGSGSLSSLECARALVEHGADVNARLIRGPSGKGKLNQTGATPFLMAADTADVEYMQVLLQLGADPGLTNSDGATPLMAAAGLGTIAPGEEAGTEEECLEAVKFLLNLGADLNAVDGNGETAMHGAAYKSAPSVVRFLHQQGARIDVWNRHNKYGWTPLLIARGYRPGNFRPAAETISAICDVMQACGVVPPMDELPLQAADDYESGKKKR